MSLRGIAMAAVAACAACGGESAPADDAVTDAVADVDAVDVEVDAGRPYVAPDAWGPAKGPGGPTRTFASEELYEHCAYLDGGDGDFTDHHNLVVPFDGYLLMPWAPEWGEGGFTFFDVSDPCAPEAVGSGESPEMRESHSVGFSLTPQGGGRFAVVNQIADIKFEGGVEFWDVSDPTAPAPVSAALIPGVAYPLDAYVRVSLSVFWQAPYVYVGAADNGVAIVDATDPRAPQHVLNHAFEPTLRAGQVHAVGNLLIVTQTEGSRTVLLDISDPLDPQPIPGGDFEIVDAEGEPRDAYFSNISGHLLWYARKEQGGGIIAYDIADPTNPTWVGAIESDGDGGYVFVKEGFAFVGESRFATIYDVSDPAAITEVTRLDLEGDLDTAVPIGNVVMLAVDDGAITNQGTAAVPWREAPDATPPEVTWAWPADGATGLATTSRFGVVFSEMIEPVSVFEGSVRLYEADVDPAFGRVDGVFSAQENVLNFAPSEPLKPNTRYVLELPAGGVADFNGNALAEDFRITLTTGG